MNVVVCSRSSSEPLRFSASVASCCQLMLCLESQIKEGGGGERGGGEALHTMYATWQWSPSIPASWMRFERPTARAARLSRLRSLEPSVCVCVCLSLSLSRPSQLLIGRRWTLYSPTRGYIRFIPLSGHWLGFDSVFCVLFLLTPDCVYIACTTDALLFAESCGRVVRNIDCFKPNVFELFTRTTCK